MPMPTSRKWAKLWIEGHISSDSQGDTNNRSVTKTQGVSAKAALILKIRHVKDMYAKITFKIFPNITEMGCITYKKDAKMTVTATNVLILGAVFMFAARVFMGF